jgi:hypothetical protein
MQRDLLRNQRASTTAKLAGTRFQTEMLEPIEQWRRGQADLPTHPELVRRLVEKGIFKISITHEFAIKEAELSSHCRGEKA